MENLEFDNMKSKIADKVRNETKRLNELAERGEQPSPKEVKAIPLDNFREAFDEYGDEFLSEDILNKVLKQFEKNLDSLKLIYPEGSKLILGAFPCNINGTIHSDEDIKNGKHLTTFFIDKKTGLSHGFGSLRPSTHAQFLPGEIKEECSFTVHYDSETPWVDDQDLEKFKEQYSNAYHNLKELLKGEQ
jgi:hypothetical protein